MPLITDIDMTGFGHLIFLPCIITQWLWAFLDIKNWTWLHVLYLTFTILLYIPFQCILLFVKIDKASTVNSYGSSFYLTQPNFILSIIVTIAACLLPYYLYLCLVQYKNSESQMFLKSKLDSKQQMAAGKSTSFGNCFKTSD